MVDSIAERVTAVRAEIEEAAKAAGRDGEEVRLMGVSKFHPFEMIFEASPFVDLLGENRVQEAAGKRALWPAQNKTPWHLIGHLQKNKARKALEVFDLVESVDSIALAKDMDRILAETGRETYPVFIEVNMSGEASKNGVAPDETVQLLDAVLKECPRLRVDGLMTIGPLDGDESAVRAAFSGLREMRERLRKTSGLPLPELSMGMSGDFRVAIEEGSTIVRVGTAIFGPRNM